MRTDRLGLDKCGEGDPLLVREVVHLRGLADREQTGAAAGDVPLNELCWQNKRRQCGGEATEGQHPVQRIRPGHAVSGAMQRDGQTARSRGKGGGAGERFGPLHQLVWSRFAKKNKRSVRVVWMWFYAGGYERGRITLERGVVDGPIIIERCDHCGEHPGRQHGGRHGQ